MLFPLYFILLASVCAQMHQLPLQFALDTGTSQYVTYYEGTMPLILAAPHGGRLFPSNIPDRKLENGTITVTDAYTKDVALGIARKLYEKTGDMPHVVILQLARTKVDVNRDKLDGADSMAALEVWQVGTLTLI
jgi:N-formylglutamate amidohydrolase